MRWFAFEAGVNIEIARDLVKLGNAIRNLEGSPLTRGVLDQDADLWQAVWWQVG